jgi:hypothetical protein
MRKAITVLFAAAAVSCTDGGGGVGIDDRTGVVRGFGYIDRDADGQLNVLTDVPAPGIAAALLLDATGDTIAQATANADGTFTMRDVPIGRYRVVATRGALGDSVAVLEIDDAVFSLAQNDTVAPVVRLGYPPLTAAQVLALPAGRRVVLDGVALNGWSTFGDSTVHVRDATGAVRAVRSQQSNVQLGDSIRVLGTTGVNQGQPVIADATLRVLSAAVGLEQPDSVSTQAAADALGGTAVNGQVRIAGAVIQDTARVAGDLIVGVDDGSGRLEVVLDASVSFNAGPYVPGATFAGRGVLVPAPGGASWRLKPRVREEAVISFPTVTIAAARALEQGRRIVIQGIALNGWTTFGDSTVHIEDATGYMRGVRVLANVAAGDSIRMLGTVGTRAGQPVLTSVTPTLIRAGVGVSAADSMATDDAASAAGGSLDAAHVRIAGAIVAAQTLPNGDVVLGTDDGSGRIDVVLDDNVNFNPGPYEPGALLAATGVLVPTGTGTWQLKPRSASDVTATYPTVTVAEARALAVGKTVYVRGIALNGWITFADSTVHVADPSAAIRVLRVPPTTLFAGDSVRVLGTVTVRNGQPVLIGNAAAVLQASVGLPAHDSVTTAVAASADGNDRDADQVAVSGTISAIETDTAGDLVLTISDGAGNLRVVLDADVGFPTSGYDVGDTIRARGVLVPMPSGTTWELKPRSIGELVNTS